MESDPLPRVKTVLLVDDSDTNRVTTKWFLNNFGYAVDCARSAEEALALFDSKIHDIVVSDNRMPGMTGSEMAHVIKLRSPGTPVLMYSGTPPPDPACIDQFLQRPAHPLEIKEKLDQMLASRT